MNDNILSFLKVKDIENKEVSATWTVDHTGGLSKQ